MHLWMVRPPGYRAATSRMNLPSEEHIMPFEVKACTIDEMHRHPTFRDRTQAKVKVVLREIRAREAFDHNLTLRVWADTNDGMSSNEVKMALLTRAATILKRTMTNAEIEVNGDGLASKPVVSG
jgi:hypothetical protein